MGYVLLHLNHRHVLMRAGVGLPVSGKHDGLVPAAMGVADRGALMPAGLWGQTGVEKERLSMAGKCRDYSVGASARADHAPFAEELAGMLGVALAGA